MSDMSKKRESVSPSIPTDPPEPASNYPWMRKDWLTPKEVAEILDVSLMTISRLIRNKELAAVKVGKQYRIAPNQLWDFIEKNVTVSPSPMPPEEDD